MEENETFQDFTPDTESEELDFTLDEETQEEKPEVDWKAAALRYKKQLQKVKSETKEVKPEVKTSKPNIDKHWQEKIELQLAGYSEDEVAFIQKNGGRQGLENPFVKTAIDAIRSQRQAEKAVVDTDSGMSEVERKYSEDELRKMSIEDLEKLLPRA